MSEKMKIIDERETQKKTTTKTVKNKGDKSYIERVRAKWFCFAFKLGFLQLTCKASLISSSCENGKYLASIIDGVVITSDEIIQETKTVTTNFNEKI